MSWKNELRKRDAPLKRDLRVGDTSYAKDMGDHVLFYGSRSPENDIRVPKAGLNELLDEYERAENKDIQRLTQLTRSAGPGDDFIRWYRRNKM